MGPWKLDHVKQLITLNGDYIKWLSMYIHAFLIAKCFQRAYLASFKQGKMLKNRAQFEQFICYLSDKICLVLSLQRFCHKRGNRAFFASNWGGNSQNFLKKFVRFFVTFRCFYKAIIQIK